MTTKEFDKRRYACGNKIQIDDGREFLIQSIDFEDRDFFVLGDNGDRLIFNCNRVLLVFN